MADDFAAIEQYQENNEALGRQQRGEETGGGLARGRDGEARLLEALRGVLNVGNAQTAKAIDAWNHARKVASEYP